MHWPKEIVAWLPVADVSQEIPTGALRGAANISPVG
jgi:hypothetical protein